MRISDHLTIPQCTDLDAYITRLDDNPDRVRESLRTFVVGQQVKERLDLMLRSVGQRLNDNRDVGRFIYGSFGCGKSHLLTVLGKMLERDELVYDLGHPALRELRQGHPWLDRHSILVVRLNMMGKRGLSTALFEAFNAALPADAPRLSFTDEERVFELIDRDAERFGGIDALLGQIVEAGVIAAPDFYHRMRKGTLDERLSLAASLLTWRDHGTEPVQPDSLWLDAKAGFERIARHAQELGYAAIAWLVDELVIWIREKNRATYVKQINDMSSLVDHDAARVIPFFVAVAVQQDIALTCPEDMSEKGFQEQLGFIKDRFPRLELEDQDLYEVAAQRVLARRPDLPAAQRQQFDAAVGELISQHAPIVRELAGNLELERVRALYPFHPALLRVLVDVTQALSRSRTAIAALYSLLDRHRELELGQFIPLAALWDVLFTSDYVMALRQNVSSKLAQRLADAADTWSRLEGKVAAAASDGNGTQAELTQLVRATLLCQLSERPYFPDGRPLREQVTASTLLRLNQASILSGHDRLGIAKVTRMFRKLSGAAPVVQVVGDSADPLIHIKTDNVDIDRVLARAKAEIKHPQRFAYMRRLLVEQLGLPIGTGNEGAHTVTWRGTRRKGKVRLANVRTLSYAGQANEFDAGGEAFLLLVDYPFDEEPGKTRQDDIETIARARARCGQWTLAWLPEHLSPAELDALDHAAGVEQIRRDQRAYLEDYNAREAQEILRALEAYEAGRKAELEEAVRRLYFGQGQIHALRSVLDVATLAGVDPGRALDVLAGHVLDKRYPNHPTLTRKVGAAELEQVAEWVVRATKTGQPVDLKAKDMVLVEAVAVPLELVFKGPSSVTPRGDGRYLARVLEWVGTRQVFEAGELRKLLMAEDGWSFGLTQELADLFLWYLLQVEGFEAQIAGLSQTLTGIDRLPGRFRLVKDEVVDSPTWDRALKVARELLGVTGRADLPTSPEQAKLCKDVAEPASKLRRELAIRNRRLAAICGWAGVGGSESARLVTGQSLESLLSGLVVTQKNAARTLGLGALVVHSTLADAVALVRGLSDEAEALGIVEQQQVAFEQLARTGDGTIQDKVVLPLRSLLKTQGSVRLKKDVATWKLAVDQHLAERMKRVEDQEAERKRLARLEEERLRLEREAELERQREAQRQSEQLRQQEEERQRQEVKIAQQTTRSLELPCVARAKVAAVLAGKIEDLLRDLPAEQYRIKLTVEKLP